MMRETMLCALIAACAFLAGCATPMQKTAIADVRTDESQANAHIEALRTQAEGYFQDIDADWLGAGIIPIVVDPREADWLRVPAPFRSQRPMTLEQAAALITTLTGRRVEVTGDAAAYAATQPSNAPGEDGSAAALGAFQFAHHGSLAGLLDHLTARTGTHWKLANEGIVVFRRDTRTFHIAAIPGLSRFEGTVTNQSGSAGGGGQSGGGGGESGGGQGSGSQASSGQRTSMQAEVDTFAALDTAVKAMLSSEGQMSVSPAMGTLSVTDVPSVLDRVAAYIADINERKTRQVALDVRLYSVDVTAGENYGINWNLVYDSLSSRIGVDALSFAQAPDDVNALAVSVIDGTSDYAGTSLLLEALATQGHVSMRKNVPVITLSGEPAPVQVTEQTSYVASIETTLVQDAGAQTTVRPGQVTTGFAMTVLPVVMDDNEILLQLQITLSALRALREISFNSGGFGGAANRIEVPQVDSRDFMQRVRLRSGQTLVLSGFESDQIKTDQRGIGRPDFAIAGGGANTTRARTVLVVLITPKVLG